MSVRGSRYRFRGRLKGRRVSEPTSTEDAADSRGYLGVIADDPVRRSRFARNLEEARSFDGEPDDLEELDRLLATE